MFQFKKKESEKRKTKSFFPLPFGVRKGVRGSLFQRFTHSPFLPISLSMLLTAYLFWPTILWMKDRWFAADSYYGHGILIPFLVAYLLYERRGRIFRDERWKRGEGKNKEEFCLPHQGGYVVSAQKRGEAPSEPVPFSAPQRGGGKENNPSVSPLPYGERERVRGKPLPLLFLLTGTVLYIASSLLGIYFLSGLALVSFTIGISLLWFGRANQRLLLPPLLFLLWMVPLPLLFISEITLKMKYLVSDLSCFAVNAIGLNTLREGSYVYTAHSLLIVDNPCSGLRSLLAFLALGHFFALFSNTTFVRKAGLALLGIPFALLSNFLRVTSLIFVSEVYGQDTAAGAYHDISGVAFFMVSFWFYWLISQKYAKSFSKGKKGTGCQVSPPPLREEKGTGFFFMLFRKRCLSPFLDAKGR